MVQGFFKQKGGDLSLLFIEDAKELPIVAKSLLNSSAMSLISVTVEFLTVREFGVLDLVFDDKKERKISQVFSNCFMFGNFVVVVKSFCKILHPS